MITITAPTGHIGTQLVQLLLEAGLALRVIARDPARLPDRIRDRVEIVPGSHGDAAVLDQALTGTDALFWLVPPNPQAPSAQQHYLRFADAAAAAIQRHGVSHVVGVSSAGHGWAKPAGVLSAAFAMDAVLGASGAAYRALSMPFYLENLLGQGSSLRDHGTFSLTCADDLPLATVATRDIAATAASLLTDTSWTGQETIPLFGPDRLTPDGMAAILSEELGRPITYRRTSLEDFGAMLASRGASPQAVKDTTEMFAAQDDGIYDEDWSRAQIGATDFRTWCREVLKPAVSA